MASIKDISALGEPEKPIIESYFMFDSYVSFLVFFHGCGVPKAVV